MTTVPDIPVVQLPALEADGVSGDTLSAPSSIWAVDIPHSRRLTPIVLAVLGVVAGVAAMAAGAAAVVSAGSSSDPKALPATTPAPATSPTTAQIPAVERAALALLAKPSTERVAFRGARGLVLAVGSGGRAAILIRGLERSPAGSSYGAWILAPSNKPARAARFAGTERAVFLTRPLGPRSSVVISVGPPASDTPAANRIVALRG